MAENINVRVAELENINVTITEAEPVSVIITSAFPGFMQGGDDGDILIWHAASKTWRAVSSPPQTLAIISNPVSGQHRIKSVVRLADGRVKVIYEGVPEP